LSADLFIDFEDEKFILARAHCLTGQFRQSPQHKQNDAEGANREQEDHDDNDDLLWG
jgi:hypothetical protein